MSLSDLGAQALAKVQQLAERGSSELHYLQKMISAGAFGLEPPQSLAAMVADMRRWGEVGMIPALKAKKFDAIVASVSRASLRPTRPPKVTQAPKDSAESLRPVEPMRR